MVTAERVWELFNYDPLTGEFNRLLRRTQSKYGVDYPVGSINDRGYKMICVDGRPCRAHQLAWLYMTGEWPSDEIDHIDRVRSNNIWANLRLATRKQNNENQTKSRANTSGHTGVIWWKRDKCWKAQIGHNNKIIALGYFGNLQDAVRARKIAEKKYFTHMAV